MTVTLMDILNELNMTPSRGHVGKGPRNERELLRYKAHVGDIAQPVGGKWEWNENNGQLQSIRDIMQSYKDGERAPSGWKRLRKGQPSAGAAQAASAALAVAQADGDKDNKEDVDSKKKNVKPSNSEMKDIKKKKARVVTLMDIIKELNMTPSGVSGGKGPRNERELLRYKAHIGEIMQPAGGKWQWDEDDEQVPAIRDIMQTYKDGARAPSGWRKVSAVAVESRNVKTNENDRKKRSKSSSNKESNGAKKKLRNE